MASLPVRDSTESFTEPSSRYITPVDDAPCAKITADRRYLTIRCRTPSDWNSEDAFGGKAVFRGAIRQIVTPTSTWHRACCLDVASRLLFTSAAALVPRSGGTTNIPSHGREEHSASRHAYFLVRQIPMLFAGLVRVLGSRDSRGQSSEIVVAHQSGPPRWPVR